MDQERRWQGEPLPPHRQEWGTNEQLEAYLSTVERMLENPELNVSQGQASLAAKKQELFNVYAQAFRQSGGVSVERAQQLLGRLFEPLPQEFRAYPPFREIAVKPASQQEKISLEAYASPADVMAQIQEKFRNRFLFNLDVSQLAPAVLHVYSNGRIGQASWRLLLNNDEPTARFKEQLPGYENFQVTYYALDPRQGVKRNVFLLEAESASSKGWFKQIDLDQPGDEGGITVELD